MQDRKDLDILTVTTTVGSGADAQALARVILERRLAACVQVDEGVRSYYRWQGELQDGGELRVTIKTLPACGEALQALLREVHPYELPQFTAWTVRASPSYAQWVRQEVEVPA